jgi:hypothetical protein
MSQRRPSARLCFVAILVLCLHSFQDKIPGKQRLRLNDKAPLRAIFQSGVDCRQ